MHGLIVGQSFIGHGGFHGLLLLAFSLPAYLVDEPSVSSSRRTDVTDITQFFLVFRFRRNGNGCPNERNGFVRLSTEETLFAVFNEMPMSMLLSIVAVILIAIFFITSADSATFVLGMQTTYGSLFRLIL